jgi:hypothetical protein
MTATIEVAVILRRIPEGSIPGAFGTKALVRESSFPDEYCLFILKVTTVPTYLQNLRYYYSVNEIAKIRICRCNQLWQKCRYNNLISQVLNVGQFCRLVYIICKR